MMGEVAYKNGYSKGQSDCLKKKYRKNTYDLVQAEQHLVRTGAASSREDARAIVRDVCKLIFDLDMYAGPEQKPENDHSWKLIGERIENDAATEEGVTTVIQTMVCEKCGEIKFVRTLIYI